MTPAVPPRASGVGPHARLVASLARECGWTVDECLALSPLAAMLVVDALSDGQEGKPGRSEMDERLKKARMEDAAHRIKRARAAGKTSIDLDKLFGGMT